MKVLTYVNGEITVINGANSYTGTATKPAFITGSNFYYEPTLKMMDDKPLSATMETKALSFINNYSFPVAKPTPKIVLAHCVDADGNYIGYIKNTNGYTEAPTAPMSADLKYIGGKWQTAVLIDKTTKYNLGVGDTRVVPNTSYVTKPVPTDFAPKSYYWTGTTWKIKLVDAKKEKITELKIAQQDATQAVIGTLASAEPATFTIQVSEAEAWTANNTTATPFIDSLLAARAIAGETKVILIGKILANSTAYKTAYAGLLGKFQALVKKVNTATTVAQISAVVW